MKKEKKQNITANLSRPSSSRSVSMRDIGAAHTLYPALQACGVTAERVVRGFTLIELLVVVLIIGILATVALPQYQKSVDKAKYMQVMTLGEKIAHAQQLYKLANGTYTGRFNLLDIEMPEPANSKTEGENVEYYFYSWGYCLLTSTYDACILALGKTDSVWYFMDRNSTRGCWAAPEDSKRANALCQAMTKKSAGTPNGYMMYAF